MRFTYIDAMIDPTFLVPLALAAEEAGYASFAVPDSICYPEESDSTYPYTPDGSREFLEDKPFIETFVLLGALAAVTSTIRFSTFVLSHVGSVIRCQFAMRICSMRCCST